MGNKEGLDTYIEGYLHEHRKVRERRETTEYDVKLSGERAVFLRDALAQRREETMILVPGAYSYSGMIAAPSSVENKLTLALAISQEDNADPAEEILVHLQASDVDDLNAALFPALTGHDERSLEMVDNVAAINNAYKVAGGVERPGFVEGFKPYQ